MKPFTLSRGMRRVAYWLSCLLLPLLLGSAILWGVAGVAVKPEAGFIWTLAFGAVLATATLGAITAYMARGLLGRDHD